MEGVAFSPERPFHVQIEFKSSAEALELAEELKTWAPTQGWSENAMKLFDLLEQEKPNATRQ